MPQLIEVTHVSKREASFRITVPKKAAEILNVKAREIRSAGITEAFFEVNSEHRMKDALRSIAVCPSPSIPATLIPPDSSYPLPYALPVIANITEAEMRVWKLPGCAEEYAQVFPQQ